MCKNVLFVINTLGRAGAEMALMEILKRFDGPEYQVDLFVLMGQGELADRIPKHVHLLNKSFSKESVLSGRGRLAMFRTTCMAMLRRGTVFRLIPYLVQNGVGMMRRGRFQMDKLLWRVLADGCQRTDKEYDLAVAYIEGGSAYYVADHVRAKKKAAFIHIDYQMAGYDRRLDRDCYLKFDKIFPISEETLNRFVEAYPECKDKAIVFHNIVDQEGIRAKAELPGGFSDDYQGIRILTVARLNKQKAFPIAIEAMRLLKDAGVDARWYVLGEGEERKNLEQLIESLQLQKDFFLLGAVDNPYPYYRQATFYVHATAFEGKSIAIQEAQTLSCSIIVSDIISNRQQVRHGEDGLVCQLSPTAVKDAILELISHPELAQKLGENAAKRKVAYEEDLEELKKLT